MHSLVGTMHHFGDWPPGIPANLFYFPRASESCTSLRQLLRVMGLGIAGAIGIAHSYQP